MFSQGRADALDRARALLARARAQKRERRERAELAAELAGHLLEASLQLAERDDRARAAMLARLARDERGQAFTTALTDRLYRTRDDLRAADQLAHLIHLYGVPRYLNPWDRAQLRAGAALHRVLPGAVARGARTRVRAEMGSVLLSAQDPALTQHLGRRHAAGVRVNVNRLGEALLGEAAAEARVRTYEALARREDIDALSVKVSSIASQLQPLSFDAAVEVVAARLSRIYAATLEHPEDKRPVVMLDMEAYRHVELTLRAMERALSQASLDGARAGVVLQAYLPDSNALQRELLALGRARVARGGAPLRMRLVKGANLAHERVECEKAGYRLPMFETKCEVDANFKRMLERGLEAEALRAVRLGVASHNLFDLAYALVLGHERGVEGAYGLEMLEGMATPVQRAVVALGADVLVYAPICEEHELNAAIAYLVRRLDENTSPENFLGASFRMRPGDELFERERRRFLRAIEAVDAVQETPRGAELSCFDRTLAPTPPRRGRFCNEPDTDFSRAVNRRWIARALEAERTREPECVASIIAGETLQHGKRMPGVDPSRPGHVPHELLLADPSDLERALCCARDDPAGFSHSAAPFRAQLLRRIAQGLRTRRDAFIACMVAEGGKRVSEADSEVSEAIDFAEYYQASYLALCREQPAKLVPRGVVLVTPPWNFPLAIPAGGVLAALMAGNRVILKPALETARIAERMVRLFHACGVPESALQLVICEDEVGSTLIRDARVDSVILTGATETARLFQRLRPGLHLLAETGGKNAYIVTAMSDRDQAITDVVQSAFGHAGQKCSAASLLILEAEVHDDPHFMETLRDAVQSLHVGSAWDPRSVVTPLIRPPRGPLARALTTLEPGERWLVEPKIDPDNPHLVSPGVKLGVTPGSFTHLTELFGPVLGVMRADNLEHALELANATGYGLTAGLSSLDEREQARFLEGMRAGNLYVNRTITGAIVQRQPFGGMGKSGFGPGAKAGGPNYVAQLCHVLPNPKAARGARAKPLSAWLERRLLAFCAHLSAQATASLRAIAEDYESAWKQHFGRAHDPQKLSGQRNLFRYLPCSSVLLRAEADAQFIDLAASCLAAMLAGAQLWVSVHPRFRGPVDAALYGYPVQIQLEPSLRTAPKRLRLLGTRTHVHDAFAAEHGTHVADAPVLPLGRFELLHYVEEQSLSIECHRYGHISK